MLTTAGAERRTSALTRWDGPLTRLLVVASVALRLAFLVTPFELHGISDFHGLGQRMLDGELPYQDFTFEYPPLAAPIVMLAGAVPAAASASVVAAISLVFELGFLWLLRTDRVLVQRYLLMTVALTPLLSGGFDAVAMFFLGAAVVAAPGVAAAAAASGTLVKLMPAVWFGARRPRGRALVAFLVALAGFALPLLVAPFDDTYLGYAVRRGVHQESVAATARTLWSWATGTDVTTAFRFRNMEIDGAGSAARATLTIFGALGAVVLARGWHLRRSWPPVDPVLATHALLLCLLCSGKVLSPQYIILGVPTAVLLGGRRAWVWGAIAVLTMAPFSSYDRGDGFMAAIAVRNLVLVAETSIVVATLVRRPQGQARSVGRWWGTGPGSPRARSTV